MAERSPLPAGRLAAWAVAWRRRRGPPAAPPLRAVVLGFAVLLAAAALTAAGLGLWRTYAAAERAAERATATLASDVADEVARIIGDVDLVLRGTIVRLSEERGHGPRDTHRMLADRNVALPQIRWLGVTDAEGRLRHHSTRYPAPQADLAGEDFFRALRDDPSLTLAIGAPQRNLVDGPWTIPVARRIKGPHGEFEGIVLATLEPRHLDGFLAARRPGEGYVLAVFRADGVLLARAPRGDEAIGRSFAGTRLFREMLPRAHGGSYREPAEGGDRQLAWRRASHHPLVVRVTLDRAAALAAWRQEARLVGLGAVAGLLLVGLFVALLLRQLRRLNDSEAQYRTMFELSAAGMVWIDPASGRFLRVNRKYAEFVGYTVDELLGMTFFDVTHPDDRAGDRTALARHTAIAGDRLTTEKRYVRKDGVEVWGLRAASLIRDAAGRPRYVLAMVQDITEAKRAEAALRGSKKEAEAANRAKSQFLASMSHELRTPLNAVIGFAELLQHEIHGPLGQEAYRDYVGHVAAGGRHLLRVINDILDLSKVEAGQMEIADAAVDLGGTVDEVVRLLAPRAAAAGVALEAAVAPDLGPCRGDELRLKQVLLNLVSNAVKFTPAGGRAAVRAGRDEGGRLVITVSDTGIGIGAEDMPRLFKPFSQLADAYSRSTEGTGLGLVIARRIVELHGGALDLDSAPGRGTTARVVLPADRLESAAAPAGQAA